MKAQNAISVALVLFYRRVYQHEVLETVLGEEGAAFKSCFFTDQYAWKRRLTLLPSCWIPLIKILNRNNEVCAQDVEIASINWCFTSQIAHWPLNESIFLKCLLTNRESTNWRLSKGVRPASNIAPKLLLLSYALIKRNITTNTARLTSTEKAT